MGSSAIVVKCMVCGHCASMDRKLLEDRFRKALTHQYWQEIAQRFICSICLSKKVTVHDEQGRFFAAIRYCHRCGTTIPSARLDAVPDTQLCVDCVKDIEERHPRSHWPQPPAHLKLCPRCKNPTIVRQNSDTGEFFVGCTRFPRCFWSAPYGRF